MENIVLEKINFVNGSAGKTPLNSNNMNAIQQNTENAINEVVPIITGIEENTENNNSDIAEAKINIENNTNNIIEINNFIKNSMKTMEAEGTSIHVTDSADYPCQLKVEGESEQVQTEQGKNLLPINIYEFESNVSKSYTQKIFLKKDVSYKFSYKTEGTNIRTYVKNDDGITIAGAIYTGATINVENDGVYTFDSDRSSTEVVKGGRVYDIQLEEGATATEFEPFIPDSPSPNYPSEIENVSGDLEVKVVGKNLFNINEVKQAGGESSTEINGNILTLTATGTLGAQYSQYFLKNVNFEKTYIFSFKVKKIVAGNNSLLRVMVGGSNDGKKYTFIKNIDKTGAQTNVEYSLSGTFSGYSHYRFYIYNNVSTPVIIGEQTKYYNMQIEEGTVSTECEPYKEQTVTFPFSEGQKLMQGGYLGKNGVVNKRKQYIFTGNETLLNYGSTDEYLGFAYVVGGVISNNVGFCNFFKLDAGGAYNKNANSIWIASNNGNGIFRFSVDKNVASTLAEAKSWLAEQYSAGTPVIVEYEMQEEETTAYTSEQQTAYNELKKLKTYRTVTNISNNQDTKMKLNYKKDLQTQLQELETMLLESGV